MPKPRSWCAWRSRSTSTLGVADDSQSTVTYLSRLAAILDPAAQADDAIAVYAELDKAMANWDPPRREVFDLNGSRISSLYAAGQIERGIAAAEELLKRNVARVGEGHFDTAGARGTLRHRLHDGKARRDAMREFRAAIPVLMAAARENADDDNDASVAARSQRLQNIVEAYIALLDRGAVGDGDDRRSRPSPWPTRSAAVRCSRRWRRRARACHDDPALADLVREEQDLTKQVNAAARHAQQRAGAAVRPARRERRQGAQASIVKLRGERDKERAEIAKRFPSYADLIDPKPPTVEEIKATLKPDEALLSFYFGRDISFVWAVPKDGQVAFAAIHATAGELESQGPQAARGAGAAGGDDLRHSAVRSCACIRALRACCSSRSRAGWKPAKNLIVVTNGALGLLPLSLLPTAPAEVKRRQRAVVLRLPRRAVAGAHACGEHGAVGGGAAHVAANAARARPSASR